MRCWSVLVLGVTVLCGCGGASQQRYQEQSVRLQQVEAEAAELRTQLDAEHSKVETLRADLSACGDAARTVDASLRDTRLQAEDLQRRLQECGTREEAVRADLDLTRRSLNAGEADLARARQEQERNRDIWGQREEELLANLEAARSENAILQAEIHVLLEEKRRVEREKREKLEEISDTYEGLLEGMREQVEQGRVTISNLRGQLSVKLQDEILFDSGSAVVKPEGQALLAEIGRVLQEVGDRGILVEGHTDDVPISGELSRRYPSNWELSAARALSVVRRLQAEGVDPRRLTAAGRGEYMPAVPNDSAENRARNRRIEMKLVPLEVAPVEADGVSEGESAGAPQTESPAGADGEPGAEPTPADATPGGDSAPVLEPSTQ